MLTSILCITQACFSQKAFVSGVVFDSIIQKPLAYATAGLYKGKQDKQVYLSSYTNEKGAFQFKNLQPGDYTLVFSYTGRAEVKKEIELKEGQHLDLGTMTLPVQEGNLKGVTIITRKPLIEQQDDKIIYNTEADPASKTESALDILRKTPFVSVDGNDNIQVNGQSNFKVLLNGRETSMFVNNVSQVLKSFPGNTIVKIEVITNPSAKYDAEGVGGIINIITAKKVLGYNGSIGTYYSSTGYYNINTNLSLKFGKFGVTGSFFKGGNNGVNSKYSFESLPYIPTFYTRRTINGNRRNQNAFQFGDGELSWEPDSLRTISIFSNTNGGTFVSKSDQIISTELTNNTILPGVYNTNTTYKFPTTTVGGDYIQKFPKNADKEFSLRFQADLGTNNSEINSEEGDTNGSTFIMNNSLADDKEYTTQADYTTTIKKNKLESGVKIILRRASSDFESLVKNSGSSDYLKNPANSNVFDYHQNVYGAYTSYNFKIKKYSFRLGVRGENTVIDGNFRSSNTTINQSYFTFIPNVQVTHKLSSLLTLVASYSKRIQRPYITNLNPFVFNNDSLNISYGNPDLKPQNIHTFSLQTRIFKGKTFASLSLSGNYSPDMIVQYASFNTATGVTSTTSGNIGKQWLFIMNISASTALKTKWRFFLNGNISHSSISNVENSQQNSKGLSGNAYASISCQVSKLFSFYTNGGFFRQAPTIQTSYSFYPWYGLGMSYKFLKQKLTASLSANNFFKKYQDFKAVTKDANFQNTSIYSNLFRSATIGLTWNFGKLKENVSKKKTINNDDLLNTNQTNNGQGAN